MNSSWIPAPALDIMGASEDAKELGTALDQVLEARRLREPQDRTVLKAVGWCTFVVTSMLVLAISLLRAPFSIDVRFPLVLLVCIVLTISAAVLGSISRPFVISHKFEIRRDMAVGIIAGAATSLLILSDRIDGELGITQATVFLSATNGLIAGFSADIVLQKLRGATGSEAPSK